jgi:DNA-binding MarR family transcriptional regulator
VGSLVDYLEEHGYVERRPDPRNRRATLVCLTDRGRSEMHACAAILAELEDKLNNVFGSDRLSELRARVTDLHRALGELT